MEAYWEEEEMKRIERVKRVNIEAVKPIESREELDKRLREEFPIFFIEMNGAQERFIRVKNRFGNTPKRRILEAGNKVGKTQIALMEDLAHSFGFRPWLVPEDPDYKVEVKIPNIGMIGCETHKNSVKEKIEPTLRWMVPSLCQPIFKPGPTGVLMELTLPFTAKGGKCGSKIYIRSYNEDKDSFEGIDYDWIHWDEPPPEDIFKAAERGKIVTNAPSWFSMTPLKEAWLYSKFSSRAAILC